MNELNQTEKASQNLWRALGMPSLERVITHFFPCIITHLSVKNYRYFFSITERKVAYDTAKYL